MPAFINHVEVVEALLKGMICAADIINTDVDKAMSLLQGGNYYRVPDAVLKTAFNSAPSPISFSPDVESIQYVVDEMSKLGYIDGKIAATDIFRTGMIESLEQ